MVSRQFTEIQTWCKEVKKEEKERWAGDMDRKKRREQTHTAYMQILDTKTTTEQVIGVRGQRTTMESVIPVGWYREREREQEGRGERARKAQNYRKRGEDRRGTEWNGMGTEVMQLSTNMRESCQWIGVFRVLSLILKAERVRTSSHVGWSIYLCLNQEKR